MSEKSILNLLSSVAILKTASHIERKVREDCHLVLLDLHKNISPSSCDSRSPVVVNAIDFAANEDANPAVAPLAPVGQQEGNQQSQTCKDTQTHTALKTRWQFSQHATKKGYRASTVQLKV